MHQVEQSTVSNLAAQHYSHCHLNLKLHFQKGLQWPFELLSEHQPLKTLDKYQIPETKACDHSKVIKGARIRNRYNQVPHLTQDANA